MKAALIFTTLLVLFLGQGRLSASPLADLDHRDKLFDLCGRGSRIWVVGHPGLLLRSDDGGNSFSSLTPGVSEPLLAVDFVDERRGLIVGRPGLVLRTEDGGDHWERIESGATQPLFGVAALPDGRALAVGHFATLLLSLNHGKTWQRRALQLPEEALDEPGLHDVTFVTPELAFVVGELGTLQRSRDGGTTWSAVQLPLQRSLYAVAFSDPLHGAAVGAEGTVLLTEDGGEHWLPRSTGTTEHLFALHLGGEGTLVAVGGNGTLVTLPSGGSPLVERLPLHTWLSTVLVLPSGHQFLAGDRGNLLRRILPAQSFDRLSGR